MHPTKAFAFTCFLFAAAFSPTSKKSPNPLTTTSNVFGWESKEW
jgi:hypothetical protein